MEVKIAEMTDAVKDLSNVSQVQWGRIVEIGFISLLLFALYYFIKQFMKTIDNRNDANEARLNHLEDTLKLEQDNKDRCIADLRETTAELKVVRKLLERGLNVN